MLLFLRWTLPGPRLEDAQAGYFAAKSGNGLQHLIDIQLLRSIVLDQTYYWTGPMVSETGRDR